MDEKALYKQCGCIDYILVKIFNKTTVEPIYMRGNFYSAVVANCLRS